MKFYSTAVTSKRLITGILPSFLSGRVIACIFTLSTSLSADVEVTSAAPTGAPDAYILASQSTGSTDTSLFPLTGTAPTPIAGNANHARGQLFSLDPNTASTYEITAITFQKNTNQTFTNDTLTLRIFQGDEDDWNSGTGHDATDTSFYNGTSVVPLYEEQFILNGLIQDDNYITLELATPLVVNLSSGSDFGFFMTYDPATGTSPDQLGYLELNGGNGRISMTTTAHGASSSRSINHFITGTAGAPPVGVVDLELGAPFQNRMILQRDKPINIWGTSDPGASISVSIAGHNVSGTTDASGNWIVEIPTTAVGGGAQTLTVTAMSAQGAVTTETVTDVLYGDVWFCFGQSNMRWRFSNFSAAWETFYTTAIPFNDNIRYLRTTEDGSLTEQESTTMSWLDGSSVNSWSAVASVFAYQLNQATGVPVAIIDSAWGSSSIEGWMPRELENDFPHFEEMLPLYQSLSEYRAGTTIATRVTNGSLGMNYSSNEAAIAALSGSGFADGSQANIFMRQRPNIIYNERVHPLRRYGISGFIWYQGEANAGNSLDIAQYQFSLPRMVDEYRARFEQGNLPFLGVQLPSYNASGPGWQWFRESQDSLLNIPNAYVAMTLDTGASGNIHPSDKEEIGVRLSLLAREHALNESIEGDSPRFASQMISGNEVILTFDNAAGLTTDDNASPAGFEVAGSDGIYHAVTSANISGNTITVSSTAEPAPVSVRYAWTSVTHNTVNVINGATQPSGSPQFADQGLPLAPFRTDSLPMDGLIDQAPFGVDDAYSVARDGVLGVVIADGVLVNDFDLNLDPFEAVVVTQPSHGVLSLLSDGSFIYTPEEGFAGEDSFTYAANSTNGTLNSQPATVTITVEGSPTAYYTWRNTIPWLAGQDQTTQGDPDSDGVSNFIEFALGMNPLTADSSGLPTIIQTSAGIEFDFNNAQPGVLYEVEISTDLNDWGESAFAGIDNSGTTPVIIPTSEMSTDGKLFARLRISENSNQ